MKSETMCSDVFTGRKSSNLDSFANNAGNLDNITVVYSALRGRAAQFKSAKILPGDINHQQVDAAGWQMFILLA